MKREKENLVFPIVLFNKLYNFLSNINFHVNCINYINFILIIKFYVKYIKYFFFPKKMSQYLKKPFYFWALLLLRYTNVQIGPSKGTLCHCQWVTLAEWVPWKQRREWILSWILGICILSLIRTVQSKVILLSSSISIWILKISP